MPESVIVALEGMKKRSRLASLAWEPSCVFSWGQEEIVPHVSC